MKRIFVDAEFWENANIIPEEINNNIISSLGAVYEVEFQDLRKVLSSTEYQLLRRNSDFHVAMLEFRKDTTILSIGTYSLSGKGNYTFEYELVGNSIPEVYEKLTVDM